METIRRHLLYPVTTCHPATTKIPYTELHNTCLSARERACDARDKQGLSPSTPPLHQHLFHSSYMQGGRVPGTKRAHGTPETKLRCWGGGRREKMHLYLAQALLRGPGSAANSSGQADDSQQVKGKSDYLKEPGFKGFLEKKKFRVVGVR